MQDDFLAPTLPGDLPDNPMDWAAAWLKTAADESVQRNPNSVTLATVDADGRPSARVVLCKDFVTDPGYLVFYTNYRSRKVRDLQQNAFAAATFHWDALGRQVRMEGPAILSPGEESDRYFASRDWGSQVGAWGSDQSQALESRAALFRQVRERAARLGIAVSDDLQSLVEAPQPAIPRPQHWGGIRLWPERIELWIEGADRIHDRACWTRDIERDGEFDFSTGPWQGTRLQP